jgi:hypothetical protein
MRFGQHASPEELDKFVAKALSELPDAQQQWVRLVCACA